MVGIILVSVEEVLDISVITIYIIDTRCKERGKEWEDETSSDYETEVDFGRSPSTIVAMSGADLSDDEGAQPHGSESPCLCAR